MLPGKYVLVLKLLGYTFSILMDGSSNVIFRFSAFNRSQKLIIAQLIKRKRSYDNYQPNWVDEKKKFRSWKTSDNFGFHRFFLKRNPGIRGKIFAFVLNDNSQILFLFFLRIKVTGKKNILNKGLQVISRP